MPCFPAKQPAGALQVQDAHVLVPTTGVVSTASIAAAKDLQLIVQPASGGLPCMISMHRGMGHSNNSRGTVRPAAISHAWASCSRCCIAGYNNIDLAAAKERGVTVCTSPGVNAGAVAEAALMVMLMLTRRYKEQQARPLVQPHSWHTSMRGLHLWGTSPQPCLEQPDSPLCLAALRLARLLLACQGQKWFSCNC